MSVSSECYTPRLQSVYLTDGQEYVSEDYCPGDLYYWHSCDNLSVEWVEVDLQGLSRPPKHSEPNLRAPGTLASSLGLGPEPKGP